MRLLGRAQLPRAATAGPTGPPLRVERSSRGAYPRGPGSVGEGLPGVGGRRRRRAGKACGPRVPAECGGWEMLLGRERADVGALATRRGSRSFPHARHETVSGLRKVWWSPAPPGGPSSAPSPARCLNSTPAVWPSLPYPSLSRVPNSSQLLVLSFPTPFFLTFSLFFRPTFPGLSFPHSVLSFSCFTLPTHALFLFSFLPTSVSFLIHLLPQFPSSLHLILLGFYASLLPVCGVCPSFAALFHSVS